MVDHLPLFVFSAEKAVNERLTQTPELYLLALAQFAIAADTEVVCPFFLLAYYGGSIEWVYYSKLRRAGNR